MKRFWKAVLLTTLVAGTLDIIAAHVDQIIRTGAFPANMFYAIAGGAVGFQHALAAGPVMIPVGIFIHYFISFAFTLFFFFMYPRVSSMLSNKYLNALLYALFVWLTMTFVVLPLSALPQRPFVFTLGTIVGIGVLTIVFGLPISVMADNYYKRGKEEAVQTSRYDR